MSKISLNPKYTNNSGNSWSTTTYNSLEYHISTNKYHSTGSTLKCEFTTPYDNIDVVIEIGSSSENNFDWCYVGNLDYSSPSYDNNYLDRISGYIGSSYSPTFKKITINVAKAGTHFLIIGYRKDGSGSYGKDCGYFRLVTTEVDSMEPTEPTKYIYCGTKTTVVSEEPIKFTKTNISDSVYNWIDYQGTSKDYLWQAGLGDDYSNKKPAKISFTTSSDNTTVILKYSIYLVGTEIWNSNRFYVGRLDNDDASYSPLVSESSANGTNRKTETKEIIVPKAGRHFIMIKYNNGSISDYIYVGFSGTNVVTNTRTLVPERIFANNRNIGKVYVGSELIWSKSILNTISWETLTWDKSNNSYTYNTKGKLYISYSYGNKNYKTYLLSSPASVPHPDEITKVDFYNINSYQGNSYNCTYKLDLSEFNTYKFNSMYGMFDNCYSITKLDVSNFNTSNVTNMPFMFRNCSSLTSLDVSKWDTSNVTNMQYMFNNCYSLTKLDVSKWNTSKVTNMPFMFTNCSSLTSLDVSKWNTSKVTSMYAMFANCSSLTSLDVSKWNTSNVTDMQHMFNNCSSLTSLDVSKWDTSNVTDMSVMFYKCSSLTSLDVSKWDTSKVTNMPFMFNNCSSLTSLDVSKWDTSNVTDMSLMFDNCSSLTTLIDGHESDSYIVALNKLKVDIDLSPCVKLNYESVYAVFNGLARLKGKTITLPKVMEGKLNTNIATNKGWTIAYE